MDADRFDALAQSTTRPATRRAALVVIGGSFAALVSHRDADDATARKRKRKKRNNRRPKTCPSGTKKCGTACIPAANCCTDAECGGGGRACDNGSCICTAPAGFPCAPEACCGDEVCATIEAEVGCQGGGCPTTDWCSDPNIYQCDEACYCVTSISGTTVCTEVTTSTCAECASDAECTALLGTPAVCLPNGGACGYLCEASLTAFCVAISCTSGAPVRLATEDHGQRTRS